MKAAYDLSAKDVVGNLMSLYPDSGRILSVSAGRVVTSRDSLLNGLKYFWMQVGSNMRDPQWIWDQMIIDVLSPTSAVMTATYHVPHKTPKGKPHTIGGAWTAVFVRKAGKWVIIQEHLSDLPPALDTTQN